MRLDTVDKIVVGALVAIVLLSTWLLLLPLPEPRTEEERAWVKECAKRRNVSDCMRSVRKVFGEY